MPTAAVIATTLTTPDDRDLVIYAGMRDVTSAVKWDSLVIEDAGTNVRGTTSLRIEGAIADYPEIYDQAELRVYSHTEGTDQFRGFIRSRQPQRLPLYNAIQLIADDIGGLLDDTFIVSEVRPAETMQARIGYLWGAYAGGFLSGDLSNVASIGSTLPAQNFAGMTLRQAIEASISQASSSADYYVDAVGRLHVFTSESNDAPADVDADAPGAGEIAPEDLSIDYDSNSYANRVYVQGATPAGSGFFQDQAAIAAANGVVRTAPIQAPDCETAAMAQSLANMYLGRVSSGKPRGSFTITGTDGWRAGQNLTVTSTHLGLSAEAYRIAKVQTRVVRPGTSLVRQYRVEFGGTRAGGSGAQRESLGTGQLVSGQLGGASNTYVNSDGVQVTDGTNVRVQLGAIGSGDYGLKVTNASSVVVIDGTSNMFKIAATGTTTLTGCDGSAVQCTATRQIDLATGLTYAPAHLGFQEYAPGKARPLPRIVTNASIPGGVTDQYIPNTEVVSVNQTRWRLEWMAQDIDRSASTVTFRYYILKEAAL